MSIKTDGLIEASPFKVTSPVTAGFVKNNASGELEFGQAASAWDLIEFKVFSIPQAPAENFDAVLDGDVDDTYQIIFQAFGPASAGNTKTFLRINDIAAGSEPGGTRFVSDTAFTGSLTASLGTGWEIWREFGSFSSTAGIYGRCIIHAKTGKIRTGEGWMSAQRIVGPTFQSIGTQYAQRWNDSTTNITKLGFDHFGTGRVSYGWLYKIKTA